MTVAAVPDVHNPHVRDAFITTVGVRVTIEAVSRQWVTIRFPDGVELPLERAAMAWWRPAPPPIITEDVTLTASGAHVCGRRGKGGTDGTIVLCTDGTWHEVPA